MSVSHAPHRAPASQFADKKLNFLGVVRSEALKFRTLTTNWVMTLVISAVMLGLSIMGGFLVNMLNEDYSSSGVEQSQSLPAETSSELPSDMPSDGSIPTGVPTDATLPTDAPAQGTNPADIPTEQSGPAGSGPSMSVESASGYDLKDQVFSLGNMGIDMGNILIASVAVVFIAAEYATRSINTTMTVVPKRSMVYLAKMLVTSVYSFVLGFVLSAAGFFIGYLILDSGIKEQYPIEAGVWLNCLAVGLYFMMLSWMGLGFGALMRNNAGGIMMVVLCLFILPIILGLFTLGFDWVANAMDYLPNVLGRGMLAYQVTDGAKFNNVESGGLLAIWCVVPALLGYLRIRFTDPK